MNADVTNGALVCNFAILSQLKCSSVYLFNIHLKPSAVNTATPQPFPDKEAVRRNKCQRLAEHCALGLI